MRAAYAAKVRARECLKGGGDLRQFRGVEGLGGIDVAQKRGVLEQRQADELLAVEGGGPASEQALVELHQERLIGEDVRGNVAVHGPHESIAEVAGMMLEGLVGHIEAELVQIERREHGDGARVALVERMNLPDEGDAVAETGQLVFRKGAVGFRLLRREDA